MRRREWIGGLIATAAHGAGDPMSGDRLYASVKRYWELGEHRTATKVDDETSRWLQRHLQGAGFETRLQPFTLKQWFPRDCFVTVGETKVSGFPLWPVHAGTVEGELESEIAIERVPYDSGGAVNERSPVPGIVEQAVQRGAKALILITEGPTGEAIALNDEKRIPRLPVPVLLVGPRYASMLKGKRARLVIDAEERADAKATNVQGVFGRGPKTIVVSTPKSGWFRCAGERGPGIALWLAMADVVARRKSGFRYLFTANSGHELHGFGMKAFLENGAPKPADTACWIHFGAGIATYRWNGDQKTREVDPARYLTCTPDVPPVIAGAFEGLPGLKPTSERLLGELVYLAKDGYRCFGIAAGHRFHHVINDSPDNTGPELLEPVGRAFVKALDAVESRFA